MLLSNLQMTTPQPNQLPEEVKPPYRVQQPFMPVFPCWLWNSRNDSWFRVSGGMAKELDHIHAGFTHWHPDQPTAPTTRPEPAPQHGETPRTDNAALTWERDTHYIGTTVPIDFARTLERELAELRKDRERLLSLTVKARDFLANCVYHSVIFDDWANRFDHAKMMLNAAIDAARSQEGSK